MDRKAHHSPCSIGSPLRRRFAAFGNEAVKALTGVTHERPVAVACKPRIPGIRRLARVLLLSCEQLSHFPNQRRSTWSSSTLPANRPR
ncbi:hypothetical protein D3C78_1729530 [compost metagenome]